MATYKKGRPVATRTLRDSQPRLQENFEALVNIISEGHEFEDGGAQTGKHTYPTFKNMESDPSLPTGSDELILYNKDGNLHAAVEGEGITDLMDFYSTDEVDSMLTGHTEAETTDVHGLKTSVEYDVGSESEHNEPDGVDKVALLSRLASQLGVGYYVNADNGNMNDFKDWGFYAHTHSNKPSNTPIDSAGVFLVLTGSPSGFVVQLWCTRDAEEFWMRSWDNASSEWTSWKKFSMQETHDALKALFEVDHDDNDGKHNRAYFKENASPGSVSSGDSLIHADSSRLYEVNSTRSSKLVREYDLQNEDYNIEGSWYFDNDEPFQIHDETDMDQKYYIGKKVAKISAGPEDHLILLHKINTGNSVAMCGQLFGTRGGHSSHFGFTRMDINSAYVEDDGSTHANINVNRISRGSRVPYDIVSLVECNYDGDVWLAIKFEQSYEGRHYSFTGTVYDPDGGQIGLFAVLPDNVTEEAPFSNPDDYKGATDWTWPTKIFHHRPRISSITDDEDEPVEMERRVYGGSSEYSAGSHTLDLSYYHDRYEDWYVHVQLWGAGGGGARGSTSSNACMFGGGGGAYVEESIALDRLPTSLSIEVGSGGAKGDDDDRHGQDGGDTKISTSGGSEIVAEGGKGGPCYYDGDSGPIHGGKSKLAFSGVTAYYTERTEIEEAKHGDPQYHIKNVGRSEDGGSTPSCDVGGEGWRQDNQHSINAGGAGGCRARNVNNSMADATKSFFGGHGGDPGDPGNDGIYPGGGGGGSTGDGSSFGGDGADGKAIITVRKWRN